MADVLPDSRANVARGVISTAGGAWVPVFCANCGGDGGMVPEDSTFAFYLCDPCASKWGPIAGTLMVPDEVFWQRVAEAELEDDGGSGLQLLERESPYKR